MPRPRDIAAIDTLIGFRDKQHAPMVASEKVKWDRHPAEYMFKDLPGELEEGADRDTSASRKRSPRWTSTTSASA